MEQLDWLDVFDIAIELSEQYPEIDPQWISFPDLHTKICELENFIGCRHCAPAGRAGLPRLRPARPRRSFAMPPRFPSRVLVHPLRIPRSAPSRCVPELIDARRAGAV